MCLCGGLNVHTLHTRWVAIKVHPTTDTCNSDLVLNEMPELEKKMNNYSTRACKKKKSPTRSETVLNIRIIALFKDYKVAKMYQSPLCVFM